MKRRSYPGDPSERRSAKKVRRSSGSISVAYEEEAEEIVQPEPQEPVEPIPDVEESQVRDEEVQEVGKPPDKRVEQAIRKHDGHGPVERDLWDTVRHLAYQHSIDLSLSLVKWGRRGGIRESRDCQLNSSEKKFDPTANTFTLWPLPSEICPAPDWSLEDELGALATSTRRKMNINQNFNESVEDLDSDEAMAQTLADQNQKTLLELFNNLYEYHPPHSSSTPIYTKPRRSHRLKNQQETPGAQPSEVPEGKEVDYGLDWKYVLKVAESTLQLKQSVLQRTQQRLSEIYGIPWENSQLDQDYVHQRKLKRVDSVTPSKASDKRKGG